VRYQVWKSCIFLLVMTAQKLSFGTNGNCEIWPGGGIPTWNSWKSVFRVPHFEIRSRGMEIEKKWVSASLCSVRKWRNWWNSSFRWFPANTFWPPPLMISGGGGWSRGFGRVLLLRPVNSNLVKSDEIDEIGTKSGGVREVKSGVSRGVAGVNSGVSWKVMKSEFPEVFKFDQFRGKKVDAVPGIKKKWVWYKNFHKRY